MRKIFTLLVLSFITVQFVTAQTVIRDEIVNFSEMAAYEAAHPELFKPCPSCPRKEADGGWEDFATPNMSVPAGAKITMAPAIPKKNENEPLPMAPSRGPAQQWLGHVDPGSVIPPDAYGAVGLNHVITSSNDFIRIHAKVGGAVVSSVSTSTFTGVGSSCDPQFFFDPSSQRWIACFIRCTGSNDQVILMASLTSDPTGAWRNFQFIPVAGGIPDHPYLGFDDGKIAIGARKFAPGYLGPDIYLFDKAAFLANTAMTFGTNAQTISASTAQGDAPRPVTIYFPPYSNVGNPQPGTMYILQSWSNSSLRLTTITGTIPGCVWNTGSAVFPTAPDSWTAGNMGNSISQQPPETRLIAANDGRMSSAIMMNGKIWASHHIGFPAGASGGAITHTDVQYWVLDGAAGTFGNVIQRGRTGAVAGQHRWFSSIAVNKNEDVLIGYSMSNNTTMWPSAAYSTRQIGTPANTLDDPLIYHLGESRYWKDFGSARTRWGDYSQSHLDPVDQSLWTIQEYASTPAGAIPPDNNSRYGLWWAQVPASSAVPIPAISAGTITLITESCAPANGVVDPGETVTMQFCLNNSGTGATTAAVGNLLASGGIIAGSSQNYGVIANGGGIGCQNFTFTNNSTTCGATLTASMQVQDGALNLGTVNWTIPLGATVVTPIANFDAVVVPALPAGWVATNVAGGGVLWVTSNSGTPAPSAFSAPNSAFIDDPGLITDKQLVSPAFVLPVGAKLTFRNNYALENGYDGGVLEISINGGAYTDIVAAGGTFSTGGYTGTISSSFGNPLAGRAAWTGSAGTYVLTTVNFPVAAGGQSIRLKWRMGSDNSVSSLGWRIDDIVLTAPDCCGVPCTLICPANITVGASAGSCGAVVNFAAAASGLCGPISYSPASGSLFSVGTTTVNVSSASGSTCSFTVTVFDNVPPTINCPAPVVAPSAAGLCGANVNYPLPSVGDNCPLSGGTAVFMTQTTNNTTIVPIAIGCQAGGLTTENSWWRAYDLAPLNLPGGLTIKSVNFGIEKITGGPVPITARIYISNGTFPGATRTLVSTQTTTFPVQAGTFGTIIFGTPASVPATAKIAVEIFCPDQRGNGRSFFLGSNNLGESAPSYLSAASCGIPNPTPIADLVAVTDHIILNVNGEYYTNPPTLVLVSGIARGGFFPVGTTTNTYRATDAVGNTSTCSFTVTVNDVQAPAVTCPANITRATDLGLCYATVIVPNPTTSDNCAVTQVTWAITGATIASSPATGINYVGTRQFNLSGTTGTGVSTITYTVKDAAGNTTICSSTVTVNDGWIPAITAQPATKFFCVGSNGVFTVAANTNGGPVAYQWQEWNGTAWANIAGSSTTTYTVPNVTFVDNTRSFRVILTGLCTVVTSQFATLYVNPLPTVSLLTSVPPSLVPGQSLTITVNASPAGGSYAWYKNGALTSHTGSTWTGLTVDNIGTYKVTYTDVNGCSATTSDLVVNGQPSDNIWIYPNPNNGVFQIRFFNTPNETATISVFDAKGGKVYENANVTTTPYSSLAVDLGPTAADGTYIVVVNNSAGKKVGAKRIVVRKKS